MAGYLRPALLDLFCGAGGAAAGYHKAGFYVIGVDLADQPRYPFKFVRADALDYLTRDLSCFDAIHASPPCQFYSGMSNCRPGLSREYPALIGPVRDMLKNTGLPWVLENVERSGLAVQDDFFGTNGLLLCGAMFGLGTYRHRLFESSVPLPALHHPRHLTPTSRAGHLEPGTLISVAGHCSPVMGRKAMQIGWMNRDDLAEAIPPAYTGYIGLQLRKNLGGV